MEFSELLLKRRSVRKYEDKQVSTDLLKKIIGESTMAPSAGNEQPWKFIIINNRDMLKKISDECKRNFMTRIQNNPADPASKYVGMLKSDSFNIFYNAPSVIYILGESKIKNLVADCSLAASYLMMSAASNGLGTCWINFARELKDPGLIEQIGIPEDHTIVAPIIVGYPAIEPNMPQREEPIIINTIE